MTARLHPDRTQPQCWGVACKHAAHCIVFKTLHSL
uniref:Uncharacterized protein n=1 Tax=Anguilla anguilla TaxID=7936 RepID=A0A0E9PZA5_ANGAN